MQENFRQFLDRLRQTGELVDLHQPVDIRHIATLVDQAETALYFHNVIGYDMPVVSGIIRSRERAMMALGCETYREIEDKLKQAIDHPIPPKYVKTSPTREVVLLGDDVDLYKLPIPMSSIYDGGPMITAGVVIARDPELGINSGIYRFIVKEKSLTGIDIVTPNNMRLFAQRAYERRAVRCRSRSASARIRSRSPARAIARRSASTRWRSRAALRGAPVELAPCETIDLPYIADAEIVLEAEILPTGWTWPEGRFGEFTRLMGGLHWNPLVRIKAISMRKDAIYYNLHMPWENTWLAAPTRYAAIRQALKTAGVQVKDINVTLGGCAFWHAVISIKKQPGEGKNALLAALSVMDLKHVVVVDDDIDVYRPDRGRMGDRHPRAGRQGRDDRRQCARQAARSEPAAGLRRGADRRQGRHRCHHPGRHPAASTTSASPTPMPTAPRSPTTSTARRTRPGKAGDEVDGRGAGGRRSWTRSARSRSTTPISRSGSRPTTSAPWRARSATCTRPRSSGRTRAGGCACAARNSPPSRRGAETARASRVDRRMCQ